MKGERVPTESSEYEASDDERMKRRGVSGGLGRGKVMKGEEEGKLGYFLPSHILCMLAVREIYMLLLDSTVLFPLVTYCIFWYRILTYFISQHCFDNRGH